MQIRNECGWQCRKQWDWRFIAGLEVPAGRIQKPWEIMGGSSNPCSVQLLGRASSFFGTTWYSNRAYIYIYACIYIYRNVCIYIYTIIIHIYIWLYIYIHEWRTKLLTTHTGHGQSGWFPIGCEGLYFHPMCKNRVSVSGWPPIGCECFRTNLNIPCPLPTTVVFS